MTTIRNNSGRSANRSRQQRGAQSRCGCVRAAGIPRRIGTWRNAYLLGAQELRSGVRGGRTSGTAYTPGYNPLPNLANTVAFAKSPRINTCQFVAASPLFLILTQKQGQRADSSNQGSYALFTTHHPLLNSAYRPSHCVPAHTGATFKMASVQITETTPLLSVSNDMSGQRVSGLVLANPELKSQPGFVLANPDLKNQPVVLIPGFRDLHLQTLTSNERLARKAPRV